MRGRRKTVKISEAEWSIMKVLWDGCEKSGRGMTLGEIVAQLSETTDWSNTTIRTLIIRLSEKGAVSIDKTTGVYKYTPNFSKDECMRSEVNSFIDRVFSGSPVYTCVQVGIYDQQSYFLFTHQDKEDIILSLDSLPALPLLLEIYFFLKAISAWTFIRISIQHKQRKFVSIF